MSGSPWRGLHGLKRWIYRGDRPGRIARLLNRFWAGHYGSGGRLARTRDVELVVAGRSSGQPVPFPVVLADLDDTWYAVSMLGARANWVRNVRAADGRARIRHGGEREVRLVEVPVAERAPVLRRYLDVAPGARPHVPVDRTAPMAEFARIAADYPVFRVEGWPASTPG